MKEQWEITWKDYYTILQIHPLAEPEVVKVAYFKLAQKYAPDHNSNADANKRMKDLNEAYEIIGNPEKRRRYYTTYCLKTNPKPVTTLTAQQQFQSDLASGKIPKDSIFGGATDTGYMYHTPPKQQPIRPTTPPPTPPPQKREPMQTQSKPKSTQPKSDYTDSWKEMMHNKCCPTESDTIAQKQTKVGNSIEYILLTTGKFGWLEKGNLEYALKELKKKQFNEHDLINKLHHIERYKCWQKTFTPTKDGYYTIWHYLDGKSH